MLLGAGGQEKLRLQICCFGGRLFFGIDFLMGCVFNPSFILSFNAYFVPSFVFFSGGLGAERSGAPRIAGLKNVVKGSIARPAVPTRSVAWVDV